VCFRCLLIWYLFFLAPHLRTADGAVGAAEVARFPGFVQRAEGVGNVLRELRARGGVDGIRGSKGFEDSELMERTDDLFWIGQNRDRVRLEAGAGRLTGFELALEDDGGIGEFLSWQAELRAKKDLGRPASGQSHEAHAFFEVAIAGQEFESFLDEGLRIQRAQVGLVLVDALVIANVQSAGFFRFKRKIAEALAGAHLSWA
jgi:hypothetical protein